MPYPRQNALERGLVLQKMMLIETDEQDLAASSHQKRSASALDLSGNKFSKGRLR
jgi:hypothetical protein